MKKTTKAQRTATGATALSLYLLLKDGWAYMVGLNWHILSIDWTLAKGWLIEILALLALLWPGISFFEWVRARLGVQRQKVQRKVINPPVKIEADKLIESLPELSPLTHDDTVVVTVPKNYFSDEELDCRGQMCECYFPGMEERVMKIANEVRERFGPMVVQSAYRCEVHNASIPGASKNSYHKLAKAIDLRPTTVEPREVYDYLCKKYPKRYGYGLYARFVHIDTRTNAYARKAGPDEHWHQYPLTERK